MNKELEQAVRHLQEQYNKLAVDVLVLEQRAEAAESIAKALAVTLGKVDSASASKVLELLEATILYQRYMEPETNSYRNLIHFRQVVAALLDADDPAQVLVLSALQGRDAGPDRLDALRTWQEQASVEELADDMSELLKRLTSNSPQKPSEDSEE